MPKPWARCTTPNAQQTRFTMKMSAAHNPRHWHTPC
jgi:hypothetical protein